MLTVAGAVATYRNAESIETMTFGELLQGTDTTSPVSNAGDPLDQAALARTVTAVAYDSRQVTHGSVFVALQGHRVNGAAFAQQALTRGALAIVSESLPPPGITVPWLMTQDARLALAALAATFYRHPSTEMLVVGITGTNGKTTTSYLIGAIFERAGVRCGRLGSVSYRVGSDERDAERTTPEAPDVQRLLREMVDRGCGACVMEVSSHALALKRADQTRFVAAVFTNLTRDHLDFHGDMESYFQAKQRLFQMIAPGSVAIVNMDDPRGASLVDAVERPVTYAIDHTADVVPNRFEVSLEGLSMDVRTPRGLLYLRSRLIGRTNVYNILAAVSACTALDLPFSAVEQGVAELGGVPGRLQVISDRGDDVTVVVDYAHTDDALRLLLETAREFAPARVITVFGCGGNRDRTKRPLMGVVAARLSDLVVVTTDNPRSEDPAAIIEEIKGGIETGADRIGGRVAQQPVRGTSCLAIIDRRMAIERAIREAHAGDIVLVAGKGHEKYQVIGDRMLPFDDVAVALDALARRRTNTQVS